MTDARLPQGSPDAGKTPRRRRVVFVEYDITAMTEAQVDALLAVLAASESASFHVEVQETQDPPVPG